jgi:FKBP-type peptidyl-prolyl cis-trans isomerase SlyD
MVIADKKIVSIDYTLTNDAGEVVETSGGQALEYLHGAGQIVPGLERGLTGLEVGEVRDIVVEPADGYGDRDPEGVFGVPCSAFPGTPEVGASFVGEDEEGNSLPVQVIAVEGDTVVVDANHPMAGERLHFHIDVRAVRDATPAELADGRPEEDGEQGE